VAEGKYIFVTCVSPFRIMKRCDIFYSGFRVIFRYHLITSKNTKVLKFRVCAAPRSININAREIFRSFPKTRGRRLVIFSPTCPISRFIPIRFHRSNRAPVGAHPCVCPNCGRHIGLPLRKFLLLATGQRIYVTC
jgi:hypothetical protein